MLAMTIGVALTTAPAQAQVLRTWVSGNGDDSNKQCSRTAPCKTFAGAVSKTAAGGEINCIDAGGYGAVTISKSLIIDCSNTEGGISVGGSNGITVSAGRSDVVVLRGLDISGQLRELNPIFQNPTPPPGVNGIVFNTGAVLHVEKCRIRQLQTISPFPVGFGILFQPAGGSELYVTDTIFTSNGSASVGGAIMIRPSGAGSAKVAINRVDANHNNTGITADGGSTTGTTTITVRDSMSAGALLTGYSVVTPAAGGGTTILTLDHSSSLNNATGIHSDGPKSLIVVTASTIVGNTTGLSATNGGQVLTYQNNFFNANSANGTATGVIMPQ